LYLCQRNYLCSIEVLTITIFNMSKIDSVKTFILLTNFVLVSLVIQAKNNGQRTYDQSIKEIELKITKPSGVSQNKLVLEFANSLKSGDFIDEMEYLRTITSLDKFTLPKETNYLDVQYTFGSLFQTKKKFREAYPYFYKITQELKKRDQDFEMRCLYYEYLGLNYFYFRRLIEAEVTLHKGLDCAATTPQAQINIYNTLGLIYLSRKDLSTAETYYQKALKAATDHRDEGWIGVIKGNLGDLFYQQHKYFDAHKYLTIDYQEGMKNNQIESAMNALGLLVRVDLAMKNQKGAANDFFKLDSLVKTKNKEKSNSAYLMAKVDYYKSINDYKTAFESYEQLRKIQIEANRERDLVNIKNTEFQFEFERKQAEINLLQESKKVSEAKLTAMWFAISTLLIAAIITVWQISKIRQRDKELLQLKNEQIQVELKMSESELRNVVRNLMEKNNLINDLNEELTILQQENSKSNSEQEALTKTLQSFTLLTEEDWVEFKRLFEKCYVGFFDYFNTNFEDITNAEIRLAALIKLDLENLEMSNALGISPDSVRKTNLRLRKRLGIQEQKELQKFIRAI